MTYTNEEIKIIKNNIKAIEKYCESEILPQITESISITLRETQYRSDGSPFVKTYGFYIGITGEVIFTSSALRVVLNENHEGGSTSVNAFKHWHYTIELLERWQTIKAKLHDEIRKTNAKKSALLNFQI